MGKTGSWMQSIKKAIHNHIHGDLDRDKFQHLPHVSSESKECSTSSSHIIDESKEDDPNRRSSPTSQVEGNSYRGNSLKEEKARISNSRKEEKARTSTSRKDQKARISSSSNQANAAQTGSGQHKDGNGRLSTASQQQFGVSGSRDHHTYENAVYGDHESGSGHHHNTRFGSNSHQEEKRRSSTSLDRRNDGSEGIEKAQAPRHSTHSEKGGSQREEKGRSSTSSQGVPTEKKRSSNVYLTHNERTLLEKGRAITAPDQYNMQMLSGKGSRPGTPVSPDNRTKLLQIEKTDGSSTMHVMDKAASDKGRYRGPSSPRVQLIEKMHSDKSRAAVEKSSRQQTLSPQLGQCTALQDLLKPSTGSLEKRSSSSSSIYFSQVGGSARSCTSNGSQSSKEEFVELVFPLAQETRKVLPASPKVQRKKVISPSTKDVFSMPEYDVPLSPGGQRRRSSGTINTTVKEPVSTKSLLPPDYRKQQPARALADVGSVIFRSGDAGVGGMLGEWAAVAIQASWRGFAARQAYKALRGLVRLQALVRGYLVRRKITPLVKARIQAARVHQKLSRNNANVQLHQTSNGYGIALTVLESSRSQYGYAQPVLDDSQVRARGSSGAAPDALKCDVSGWNSSIILCTLAELKQEVLMKKERASKRNEGRM